MPQSFEYFREDFLMGLTALSIRCHQTGQFVCLFRIQNKQHAVRKQEAIQSNDRGSFIPVVKAVIGDQRVK